MDFLDNEPLSTYVTKEYDTHVEYEAPMLYKGEQMNLIFAWVNEYAVEGDTSSEVIGAHYEVYGFRRGIDSETGMPDKNMYQADPEIYLRRFMEASLQMEERFG